MLPSLLLICYNSIKIESIFSSLEIIKDHVISKIIMELDFKIKNAINKKNTLSLYPHVIKNLNKAKIPISHIYNNSKISKDNWFNLQIYICAIHTNNLYLIKYYDEHMFIHNDNIYILCNYACLNENVNVMRIIWDLVIRQYEFSTSLTFSKKKNKWIYKNNRINSSAIVMTSIIGIITSKKNIKEIEYLLNKISRFIDLNKIDTINYEIIDNHIINTKYRYSKQLKELLFEYDLI